ncbi:hypothetical protein F2P56_012378 [Juglans regia]|uniref:Reverse transcriptase domain-containing protein n=1 Tax=Juglans regia TaxID=51240 RepID=A0A834CUB5_JUGRE|nr:hypothetical protein F2P56_012378 [Juglans regia]
MDAYTRYNQIRMRQADQEMTTFITDQGLYCYKVMHFGLKNAGFTYQKLVNRMCKHQIGRNMEVYVEDLLAQSMGFEKHMEDLREAFGVLYQYGDETQPNKVHIQSAIGQVFRIHGVKKRHRGQSQEVVGDH